HPRAQRFQPERRDGREGAPRQLPGGNLRCQPPKRDPPPPEGRISEPMAQRVGRRFLRGADHPQRPTRRPLGEPVAGALQPGRRRRRCQQNFHRTHPTSGVRHWRKPLRQATLGRMLLIPLRVEDAAVDRVPWVSIGIAAICVLAFLATWVAPANPEGAQPQAAREIVKYYQQHPYLSVSDEFVDNYLRSGARQALDAMHEDPPEDLDAPTRDLEQRH